MKRFTLFKGENSDCVRIPSITAAPDGTVYAFGNIRVGSSRDDVDESKLIYAYCRPGGEWTAPRIIGDVPGWSYMFGSAACDEVTGKVFIVFRKIAAMAPEFGKTETEEARRARAREKEERDGMKEGDYILETQDGENFTERPLILAPPAFRGEGPQAAEPAFTHGSSAGITLRYGPHKGRLVLPARRSLHTVNTWAELQTGSSNTVIYSDDRGESFKTGGVVEPGTGEGAVCERSDGSLYFNSRAYFGDGLRRIAVSCDGGESFEGQAAEPGLIECCCNAGLVRAETKDGVIFFFSNPYSRKDRVDMTIHYSLDEGQTWKKGRTLDREMAAYSCLAFSEAQQKLFLLFECGKEDSVERVDLAEMTPEEACEDVG